MVEISEVLAEYRSAGRSSAAYRVMDGMVVFNTDTTNNTVTARARVIDPDLMATDIPERFVLAAQYWIQHRYYLSIDSMQKAQYYYDMYSEEFAKVRHNRIGSFNIQVSDNI